MRKLYTSSNAPIDVEIDGKVYVAEKLNIADYVLLSALVLESKKAAVKEKYEDKESVECLNECAAQVAPTPYDMIHILLDSYAGFVDVLYTALHKKHPEVTYDWIAGLNWNDDLIQIVYDLLDIRRKVVDKKDVVDKDKKKRKNN